MPIRAFVLAGLMTGLACLAVPASGTAAPSWLELVLSGEDPSLWFSTVTRLHHACAGVGAAPSGYVLDEEGEAGDIEDFEAACVSWWRCAEAAGSGLAPDLYLVIGLARLQQAASGPDHADDAAREVTAAGAEDWARARHDDAMRAFSLARRHAPDDAGPRLGLAIALEAGGRDDEALAEWRALCERDGATTWSRSSLAVRLLAAGELAEAGAWARRAVDVDERANAAWDVLGYVELAAGAQDAARECFRRSAFHEWMPGFCTAPYDSAAGALLRRLFAEQGDAAAPNGDLGVEPGPLGAAAIAAWSADPSDLATELLAATCQHHVFHGELESAAFAELERRSSGHGLVMLRALLQHGRSLCTLGAAAQALGRCGDRASFERMVELLPADAELMIQKNIAPALGMLGDERAVPVLAAVLLAPAVEAAAAEDFLETFLHDPQRARIAAALALGYFRQPEAQAALRQAAVDPQLRPLCSAALYRSSGDAALLPAIREGLAMLDGMEAHSLVEYVEEMGWAELGAEAAAARERIAPRED